MGAAEQPGGKRRMASLRHVRNRAASWRLKEKRLIGGLQPVRLHKASYIKVEVRL